MAAAPPLQQFNLRWNNHTANFVNVFQEQFANQTLVDVTLSCQGQFLKAHKMVLSACSPYFQELFQVHSAPHPVIIMNQMKFKDVKLIVEFMYRGEIKVLEDDIDGMLEVAETLQVKGLCTVRNKYEKGDIQSNENDETQNKENTGTTSSKDSGNARDETEMKHRKKRKMSHTVNELANEPLNEPTTNGNVKSSKNDDDLPPEIKIEPPDIKDIDDEQVTNNEWENRLLKEEPDDTRPRILKRKNRIFTSKESSSLPKASTSSSGLKYIPIKNQSDEGKGGKIPRPPNAFMIFANEWRRRLATENPRESNKDISVRLGVLWKNLSSDMKESYYKQARDADLEHKRKYPGYYYSPKEARLRKNQRDLLMNKSRSPKNVDAMRLVKVYMPDTLISPPLVPMTIASEDDQIEIDDEDGGGVDMDSADLDLDEDSDKQDNDLDKPDDMEQDDDHSE
ncbi:zinc finger and BTB domain-containing protein 14-like isoform X1 [Chrysoperla carnea]|uniref:zinc finger and BTB domain-containing protein 14-like isoform X1 n=1 Tax=Chrysoperla carnea TaxID=189513 RepID=UPI001D07745F|nr:zinc finger and BTB domain-containing protein 14-like isoform X1 [Chrysoperla carnea]XP_044735650.1 zinc finger and BTB domain-containing protein 14-like isoform X1 [Chrysoperla carnea]